MTADAPVRAPRTPRRGARRARALRRHAVRPGVVTAFAVACARRRGVAPRAPASTPHSRPEAAEAGARVRSRHGRWDGDTQAHAAARPPRRRRRPDRPVRRLGDAGPVRGHPRRAHGGARARRDLRRQPHGRGRDVRARAPRRCSSGCCPTTSRGSPGTARSTPCCATSAAACSTTSSPTGSAGTASSPSPTPPTTSATSPGSSATRRGHDATVADRIADFAMLAVQGPQARAIVAQLADGELPPRFRTPRADRRRRRRRARLRHRLHRRGRRRAARRARPAPARSGTRSSRRRAPGRARRARHAAARGLLPPLRQRPDARTAGRSRPGSAGAARRTPGSSAPTPSARRARRARPSGSCRSR